MIVNLDNFSCKYKPHGDLEATNIYMAGFGESDKLR